MNDARTMTLERFGNVNVFKDPCYRDTFRRGGRRFVNSVTPAAPASEPFSLKFFFFPINSFNKVFHPH